MPDHDPLDSTRARGVARRSYDLNMSRQPSRICSSITGSGQQCRAAPLQGSDRCLAHSDQKTRDSTGFGGAQPGAGRPTAPRATDVLKERVEAELDRWLAPFEDALGAVSSSGEPDHRTRMSAASQVLDRVYGKPVSKDDAMRIRGPTVDGEPLGETIDAEIEKLVGELAR